MDNDNDVNEPIMSDLDEKKKKSETSNRLLGRAKDLVMKLMKEVGALVSSPLQHGSSINATNTTNSTAAENRAKFAAHRPCVTPRYMILCRKCKEEFFHRFVETVTVPILQTIDFKRA